MIGIQKKGEKNVSNRWVTKLQTILLKKCEISQRKIILFRVQPKDAQMSVRYVGKNKI